MSVVSEEKSGGVADLDAALGLAEEAKDYPDKMDMGYPFNRPFLGGVEKTLSAHQDIATRKFKIRWK